ncbi:glycoside hydrolase family 16 protein [Cryptosporangium aurantiacum]|uniref:glycoside hydrolase family 16 protein n=1 Tax=Cryptosporangium aurantiacum TaxID=134849 RepID=UPI0009353001|nr:glycoside hydrolase family 16 protein [Cryptosporangium aurantiacum]
MDDFDGAELNTDVWLPHYLPAWSSRAATRASYTVAASSLRLTVPPEHGLWCADDHTPPMRVSGIQSGNWSGPLGGTRGQQPYRNGTTVREEQPEFRGWLPTGGRLEMRARMVLGPTSMAAWWLVGFEDVPEQCAEICVAEVFGSAVVPGESAEVGMGLHAFRDPAVAEDFSAPRLPIDVAEFHTYAVDWTRSRVAFYVDGEFVRECPRPPWYPMQHMLAVFDFPDAAALPAPPPELVVDYLRAV